MSLFDPQAKKQQLHEPLRNMALVADNAAIAKDQKTYPALVSPSTPASNNHCTTETAAASTSSRTSTRTSKKDEADTRTENRAETMTGTGTGTGTRTDTGSGRVLNDQNANEPQAVTRDFDATALEKPAAFQEECRLQQVDPQTIVKIIRTTLKVVFTCLGFVMTERTRRLSAGIVYLAFRGVLSYKDIAECTNTGFSTIHRGSLEMQERYARYKNGDSSALAEIDPLIATSKCRTIRSKQPKS